MAKKKQNIETEAVQVIKDLFEGNENYNIPPEYIRRMQRVIEKYNKAI